MSETIVITSIYTEFWGTKHFRQSCGNVGLPVFNAFKGERFIGNGDVIRKVYNALVYMKDKFKYAIYSDGADTFFQKSFTPPAGKVIYSSEKAVYPATAEHIKAYEEFYKNKIANSFFPWRYLNGGNYCGEINLLIEFFERAGLHELPRDINGQLEQSMAFLKFKDQFPVELDTDCQFFQTIAFEDPGDFSLSPDGKGIINNITGTYPCILHGNGRTNMTPIYQRYNL